MAVRAQLHVTGPGINRVFVIEDGQTLIGRAFECAIWLDHPLLSSFHARIERSDEGTTLTDLETERGTRLNGQTIAANEAVALTAGDVILIHPFTLAYTEVTVRETVDALLPELLAGEGEGGPEEEDAELASSLLPAKLLSGPPPAYDYAAEIPPGLSRRSVRYINYLPAIYRTDFVSRFLAMLEAILMPVEWNVANLDLRLDPQTCPVDFLPWLASWFNVTFDATWSEEMKRTFLQEAYHLYEMRGTRWAMARMLEIYTGEPVEIKDLHDPENPFLFVVKLGIRERGANRQLIERMIETDKPAHTTYKLEFKSRRRVRMRDVFSELDRP